MNNNNNTPQLRFKGFTDSWETSSLSEVVDVCSGRDYKHLSEGNIPVYGTGGYMLSVNEALSYADGIGIGRKGTIDKPYFLKAPFWTVDTLFHAIPKNNNDIYYLLCIIQKINWKQKDESTGVPSLSKVAINNVNIVVSQPQEQQQIGTFFQKLDKLIADNEIKLDKLHAMKKALLTKMFPQHGVSTPSVRFRGFVDNWGMKTLGEVGEIVTGSTPSSHIESYYSEQGSPWVTPTDISDNITYKTAKHLSEKGEKVSRMVPKDTILVTCIASIGKNTLLGDVGSFNQQINGLIPDFDQYNPYFLFTESFLWSQKMKSYASSGIMQIVNKTEFSKIETFIPTNKQEQEKIGTFFQKLDTLITLRQTELQKLKNIKKALLNKMFI